MPGSTAAAAGFWYVSPTPPPTRPPTYLPNHSLSTHPPKNKKQVKEQIARVRGTEGLLHGETTKLMSGFALGPFNTKVKKAHQPTRPPTHLPSQLSKSKLIFTSPPPLSRQTIQILPSLQSP